MNHPLLVLAGSFGSLCGAAMPLGSDGDKRAAVAAPSLPVVVVTADNTEVTRSCRIEIAPGATIEDADGNGVIHIRTPGITVEFVVGSALWGGARPDADPTGPWDRYTGIGIRIEGAADVTIRGANIHGYKVGIWATDCDGLKIEGANLSDNYRQRLKSTPEAENSSDWLFPHHNDKDEWATQHGAGLYVRRSMRPTVTGVRVRRGQNGVLLHSVNEGRFYDNDCSFLSGWGLAMFRSSFNTISRNAFDFCVRGHSEGVYNRGQDSAGILMFEQCSNNSVVENSCTHSGDGIFGFAGLEAVTGEGAPDGFDFSRKGCNGNLFAGNDLSYAPAHGLEMTFSFGNKVIDNRFVENAICGIWGGYSQDTLIAQNRFTGNGGMAYGLERGGVNIEHSAGNLIVRNEFVNNRCGIHLWWDAHGDFETKAWGKANYRGVTGNVICGNEFVIDERQPFGNVNADRPLIGLHIRDEGNEPHISDTRYALNKVSVDPSLGIERLLSPGVVLTELWDGPEPTIPAPGPSRIGESRPVGARTHLRGRDKIIMGEWGPWDHESPMVRARSTGGESHVYELFGAGTDLTTEPEQGELGNAEGRFAVATINRRVAGEGRLEDPVSITFAPKGETNGVFPYELTVRTRGTLHRITGALIVAAWQLTAFAWDEATDPRTNLEGWRALAKRVDAFSVMAAAIDFEYGHGGPKDQPWAGPIRELAPGADRFGMIARTRLPLPKGKWRITTLSDDGVRVLADGKPIIENWTWHGPTRDTGVLDLPEDREVELLVEHFEIDGHAVLKLAIEQVQ